MIRRVLLLLVAAAIVALGAMALIPRGSANEPLLGTSLTAKAPDFRLPDQSGKLVHLRSFSGRPVLITFLESHCTESCPIVAETLRRVTDRVAQEGMRAPVLIVSMDPEGDTPRYVSAFLLEHHLTRDWHYLVARRSRLASVWAAYHVWAAPANAPAALRDNHTAVTYLIDGTGRERVLFTSVPNARNLLEDLRILAGLPTKDASAAGILPEVGHVAPSLAMSTLGGKTVTLTQYRGKVVILNFWATWCPPCRRELPVLSQLMRQRGHQGLIVLGVDKLEDASTVRAYARHVRVSYPIVLDEQGSIWGTYQPVAVPQTYVIGRDGVIRAIHTGAVTQSWISHTVSPLLSAA